MLLIEFTDLTGYEDYVQYCRSNLISSRTTNLYYMTSLMEHLVLHYIKPTLMLKKTRTTESYKFEANHCIENHLLLLLTIKELYSFLKCYRLYRVIVRFLVFILLFHLLISCFEGENFIEILIGKTNILRFKFLLPSNNFISNYARKIKPI